MKSVEKIIYKSLNTRRRNWGGPNMVTIFKNHKTYMYMVRALYTPIKLEVRVLMDIIRRPLWFKEI